MARHWRGGRVGGIDFCQTEREEVRGETHIYNRSVKQIGERITLQFF